MSISIYERSLQEILTCNVASVCVVEVHMFTGCSIAGFDQLHPHLPYPSPSERMGVGRGHQTDPILLVDIGGRELTPAFPAIDGVKESHLDTKNC